MSFLCHKRFFFISISYTGNDNEIWSQVFARISEMNVPTILPRTFVFALCILFAVHT